jgi:multidrug efflux system membrane fusion protein
MDARPSSPFPEAKQTTVSKPQRFTGRPLLIGGVAIALVLGGYWYFNAGIGSRGNQRRLPAAPVRVAQVTRRDMPVVEHALGRVVANTMVSVTARVQGIIEQAYFKEGQFVKKGDLLFQIDPRPFQAAVDQAKAVLLRDEAQQRNSMRDVQRYESLKASGNVSLQQYDTARTTADMLGASVAADKAALQTAELNLGYTQIRSPVDGKTGPILIQPGNMVSANQSTTAPLVTIAQVQPIKVSFTLPQTDLPRIQARQTSKGLLAELDIKNHGGAQLSAPVDFTDNSVSNVSGTIELRSSFENGDLSLVPGELVNVTVVLDDIPNALVVPRDAVNDGPDGSYVFVVSDGKAVMRPVKVLFDDAKNVAVEGNLNPGDQVIVEGQLRVQPNGAVNVLPAPGSGSSSSEAVQRDTSARSMTAER